MTCVCGHGADDHEETAEGRGPCRAQHPSWGSRSCPDPECPCERFVSAGGGHREVGEPPDLLDDLWAVRRGSAAARLDRAHDVVCGRDPGLLRFMLGYLALVLALTGLVWAALTPTGLLP